MSSPIVFGSDRIVTEVDVEAGTVQTVYCSYYDDGSVRTMEPYCFAQSEFITPIEKIRVGDSVSYSSAVERELGDSKCAWSFEPNKYGYYVVDGNVRIDPLAKHGSGRTTLQLATAPHDSLFVWCTNNIDYPMELARRLGVIGKVRVATRWILSGKSVCDFRLPYKRIILDHALLDTITDQERECWARLRDAIKGG